MNTNKEILNKGIKYLAWTIPCLFIGPTVIHFAFINKLQPSFYFIQGLGILVCIIAVILMFMGIKTMVKSLFGN